MIEILLNNILPFVIILTVLVFVHELGHYLAALKNGVEVEVFSIGFGKEIFGFTDKDDKMEIFAYSIRWICKNAWRFR